jgi:hypothetical protein
LNLALGPLEAPWQGPDLAWLSPFLHDGGAVGTPLGDPRWSPLEACRALEAWVLREAPPLGCALVHAAAVTARDGGIVLLCGPPGVGKSTAARRAGPRFFADNAVLVRPTSREGWALPLAGGRGPNEALDPTARTVRALAWLERASAPRVEWLPGARATTLVARACVRPPGSDPGASQRAMITLGLASTVPVCVLGTSDDSGYLPALDRALGLETRP